MFNLEKSVCLAKAAFPALPPCAFVEGIIQSSAAIGSLKQQHLVKKANFWMVGISRRQREYTCED